MQGKYNIKHSGRSSAYDQSKIRVLIRFGNYSQVLTDKIGCHKTRVAQIKSDMGIFVRESLFKRVRA